MMVSDWPKGAHDAINQLAELDLKHYPKHVHNRDAFLAKARTMRINQHRQIIEDLIDLDPNVDAAYIVDVCNPRPMSGDPEYAKRRDYDRGFVGGDDYDWQPRPICAECENTGRQGEGYCGCEVGVGKRALVAIKAKLRPTG